MKFIYPKRYCRLKWMPVTIYIEKVCYITFLGIPLLALKRILVPAHERDVLVYTDKYVSYY